MRVLIVGPRFHGYNDSIARALEHQGHEVAVHDYDRPDSLGARVRNKALHELPARFVPHSWRGEASRRAVRALRAVRPQVLLVVKGDLLDDSWWEAALTSGAKVITWLYDELARMDYSRERLASFPCIVTYSARDAEQLAQRGLNASHLPNAFDSLIPYRPRTVPEVSFIGARYPQRVELVTQAHDLGVPLRVYGRDWSPRPFDVLATRRLPVPGLPTGPQVDRAEGYGIMAGSIASINTHARQDGFTMRTFEIPGVGGLQLVDRRDVDELYIPGKETLVFDDAQELAEHVRRARADQAWARRIREQGQRRTLAEHTFIHRMQTLEGLWG